MIYSIGLLSAGLIGVAWFTNQLRQNLIALEDLRQVDLARIGELEARLKGHDQDLKTAVVRLETLRRWSGGGFTWADAARPDSLLQGEQSEQSEPSRFTMTTKGPREVGRDGNAR